MIRVEQRNTYDCMTACLASIFEVPYEEAPILYVLGTGDPVAGWHGVYATWLRERGFAVLERMRLADDGDDVQRCPWSFPGLWIGGVKSPRYDGSHAVVMHGNKLLWDPHPKREMGHLGFESADYFLPIDPAMLVPRPVLVKAERRAARAERELLRVSALPGVEMIKAITDEHRAQRGEMTNRLVAQRRELAYLHARNAERNEAGG